MVGSGGSCQARRDYPRNCDAAPSARGVAARSWSRRWLCQGPAGKAPERAGEGVAGQPEQQQQPDPLMAAIDSLRRARDLLAELDDEDAGWVVEALDLYLAPFKHAKPKHFQSFGVWR
jgi:hypothetical protein